jgi:hypothetical protein
MKGRRLKVDEMGRGGKEGETGEEIGLGGKYPYKTVQFRKEELNCFIGAILDLGAEEDKR